MSFGLLLPAGLFGLFGLLIPLLVHLQRQIQRNPVKFAALQWLAAAARPRQRLRLQQWPLLLMRLALVAVAALLLAQPLWYGAQTAPRWVLVHPQLAAPELDALVEGTEYRWLAVGFPSLAQPAPPVPKQLASLLREIDAELPLSTQLAVRLPPIVDGLDGQQLALRREVAVDVVDVDRPAEPVPAAQPARWSVRVDDADHPSMAFVAAATEALSAAAATADAVSVEAVAMESGTVVLSDIAAVDVPVLGSSSALIWLQSRSPLDNPTTSKWVSEGGVALWLGTESVGPEPRSVSLWHSADGQRSLYGMRVGAGWLLQFDTAWIPEQFPELLAPSFPRLLRTWLQPLPPSPQRASASSLQPAPIEAEPIVRGRSLESVLIGVVLVLLLLERLLAAWYLRWRR